MEREPKQPIQLSEYEQPQMQTYSEDALKERFADILSDAAFFSDTHSSPGM